MSPKNSSLYRPELDVVRFLAFLAVFLTHTLPLYNATLPPFALELTDAFSFGLPLFFTLSAYLITLLLLREREQTGDIHIQKFYLRRALRIWPLYFTAILFGMLYSHHLHILHVHLHFYIAALLICGNMADFTGSIIGHLWSISVEEQFYLFWPTVMKKLTASRLRFAALFLVLLANGTMIFLGRHHAPGFKIWSNSLVQFETFGAGILLAIYDRKRPVFSAPFSWLLLALVPALWFVARHTFLWGTDNNTPLRLCIGYAVVTFSCLLALVAVAGIRNRFVPLIYLGKVSYGLYVFHIPVLWIVGARFDHVLSPFTLQFVTLLLTIGCAALSYRFFESPFLRMKRRLELVKSRPV